MVKEPGKEIRFEEVKAKYRYQALKNYIDVSKEYIYLNHDRTLMIAVAEDGLLKNLETNFYLSIDSDIYPIQKIVGTAVFLRTKPIHNPIEVMEDLELSEIRDSDISLINQMLHPAYQKDLELNYRGSNGFRFYMF